MANHKFQVELTKTQYFAICSILSASKNAFFYDKEEKEYTSNHDFCCGLSKGEYQAMQNLGWSL